MFFSLKYYNSNKREIGGLIVFPHETLWTRVFLKIEACGLIVFPNETVWTRVFLTNEACGLVVFLEEGRVDS